MEVDFFSKNVVNFIKKLDTITYAKVLKEIELIKAFGNQVGMPYSKKIGKNLYELRTKGSTEIRLFYTF